LDWAHVEVMGLSPHPCPTISVWEWTRNMVGAHIEVMGPRRSNKEEPTIHLSVGMD